MDQRRLSYLRQLGVDCYVPRDALLEPVPSVEAGSPRAAGQTAPRAEPAAAPSGSVGKSETSAGEPPSAPPLELAGPETDTVATPDCSGFDWETLEAHVAECRSCKLCQGRTQTVFGVGDRRADLVIIGEGPGAEEDRLGEPFVGRAGQLLDAMLAAIDRGRERGGVYIGNIVKCRPPGNRDPRPDEVAACTPYLRRQLELLEPKAIVALGRVAAQQLLETKAPLAKLRGQVHRYGEQSIPVWVTYHPAYLLRSPGEKAKAWQDLKRIRGLVEDDSVRNQAG